MADQVRIGDNPNDRFVVAMGLTMLVISSDGSVRGSNILGHTLGPLFPLGGARIGYNPQDRFMAVIGNTLLVVTQDGNVFGSDAYFASPTEGTLGPVYQLTGARIGFNPQDRFLVGMRTALMIITQDGSVFGTDVSGNTLSPVYPFTGAKIGFSPGDRFMAANARALTVVTHAGGVFASNVSGHALGPVYQIGGAPIGADPQDRFMVATGNVLYVINGSGAVRGSHVTPQGLGPSYTFNPAPPHALMTISRVDGTPWVNPAFDTSSPDWSSTVVGGHTFNGYPDHKFEWVSVLHPDLEQDDAVGLSGIAVRPEMSGADLPFTHPFGSDFEFTILPNAGYEGLLATANKDPNGNYADAFTAAQWTGIAVTSGLLGSEVDGALVPPEYRPLHGDNVAVYGRWIVDAGHAEFHTEIHPPLLMALTRSVDDAGNATPPSARSTSLFRLWSRPYQPGQLFKTDGRTGLPLHDYCVAIAETLGDVRAYPTLFDHPFLGRHSVSFTIRPALATPPGDGANWRLECSYHFTVNGAASARVIASPMEPSAVQLIVELNGDQYPAVPLPASDFDTFQISQLLKQAPPDIDLSWYEDLWLDFKDFQAPIYVRRFAAPAATSPQDTVNVVPFTPVASIGGTAGTALDQQQPFPIYGWLKLDWRSA